MRRIIVLIFCLVTIVSAAQASPTSNSRKGVAWNDWEDSLFSKAAEQKRLVLLDLEAQWCHWCHVMDQQTYSNPRVIELIQKHYIPVRVDQASRPDLAARYQDYGWPATVILDANGNDLWKEAGFIEAKDFTAVLEKIAGNPQAKVEKPAAGQPELQDMASLSDEVRSELQSRHARVRDTEQGGILGPHRYLLPDAVELGLIEASRGDASSREWVQKTLTSNLKLLDPVWGGVYQYSARGSWNHPHFEKIMSTQASNISLYSAGYAVLGDGAYLDAAQSVRRYVNEFLRSSDGAYYASQDADLVRGQHSAEYFTLNDAQRRAKGIPQVDKSIYSRENGWIITGLMGLYAATGEKAVLEDAIAAARWILANRALANGGFRHGDKDEGGPFLGDNVAMLQAFLALYQGSSEREWFTHALRTGHFIINNFIEGSLDKATPGAVSTKPSPGQKLAPVRVNDQNIELARAAIRLYQYSGVEDFKKLAEVALRYLRQPAVALQYRTEPGILMAEHEYHTEPLHLTIVGPREDAASKTLFAAALRFFAPYKRVELWDKREGPLPRPDVQYPALAKPAAFVCTEKRCSLPIFEPAKLSATIELFQKREK